MELTSRLPFARRAGHGRRRQWPVWLARAGLVGRGLLYLLIGWLAIRLAFGDTSAHADQKGALRALAAQPSGRVGLLALAALFTSYALFRASLAVLDPEDAGVAKRVWYAWRFAVYAFLAAAAVALARGKPVAGGDSERDLTVRVLQVPMGRWAVVGAGLAIVAAGVWHGWRVVSGSFADDLRDGEMPAGVERIVGVVGALGTLARMISFGLVGAFLVRAGWRFDASEPVGLDESLAAVQRDAWGPVALVAVGVGLAAFGAFALARARYERIEG
ncbi:MAG TPA: DUF1206 domain-containing protein [Acidimicrobiales bacterium]|nr:DUF1206 domain-containing protein [Acidimicrobiales bacterium]